MNWDSSGTPKNLDEAIMHGLCFGLLKDARERTYLAFKDFLAQRFSVAYLNASGDELERLEELFNSIIRRENEAPKN